MATKTSDSKGTEFTIGPILIANSKFLPEHNHYDHKVHYLNICTSKNLTRTQNAVDFNYCTAFVHYAIKTGPIIRITYYGYMLNAAGY